MNYRSEDVYVSPEGVQYRIHYDQNVKAYHTEVKADGEWKPNNSSWYPHFPHACGEFDAVVKIHNLVKQEDKACNTDQPEHAGSESIAAAEAPDVSPAAVPDAISTLPDAEPASSTPAFDYSGLDAQTAEKAHGIVNRKEKLNRNFQIDNAQLVKEAYDLFANNYRGKFESFCESALGIKRRTAYDLLNVVQLLHNSNDTEQQALESAPITLLYAAAKPSAPPELVQQVKSGNITTNKQFQEAIAARKAAEEAQRAAEAERDKIAKEKAEQAKQLEASRGLVSMLKKHQGSLREAELERDAWKQRAEEAESRPVEVAIDETASEKRAQELAAEYRKEDQETIAQLRAALANQQHTTESDDADNNFEIGLQFCETFRSAWHLARKACMTLAGEDRYQMCANIQNIMKEIKGDMSHGSSENHRV
nr:MAG TPA: Protein of unknown function (DUF3102) [Caudoviricetes sp.]